MSRRSLLATVQDVFSVSDDAEVLRAARSLLDRPFVERVDEGYRIAEPTAAALRQQFRDDDAEGFRNANATFLANEQAALESQVDAEDRWFIRGRIAFYLAALDPSESVEHFITAFSEPAPGDPGPPRSWLADLVLRQRDLLVDQARSLDFFEGFQAYKRGNFVVARSRFERVIRADERDRFRAIALHLWSVIVDSGRLSDERLREAVQLSEDLGLAENEVMARNTLVFRLLRQAGGTRRPQFVALHEASALADRNLAKAERTGDRFLIAGTRFGLAQAQWLNLSNDGADGPNVPDSVVSYIAHNLEMVVDDAIAFQDFETAAAAVNLSASIQRDRRMYGEAIEILADGLRRWRGYAPPRTVKRWAQTAGSMLNQGLDPATLQDLRDLLAAIDDWRSENP